MQQKVKSVGESLSRTKMPNQLLLLSKKETRFPFSELPPPELSLMEESDSVLGIQYNLHHSLPTATEAVAHLPTACTTSSSSLPLTKPSDFTPETIPLREKELTTEESSTTDKSSYTPFSHVESSTSSLNFGMNAPPKEGDFNLIIFFLLQ